MQYRACIAHRQFSSVLSTSHVVKRKDMQSRRDLTVLCTFCCRDYTAADVLTTANALQRSKLQTLSVACGRVRVPRAYANATLSVMGCDDNSTECQQAAQLVDQGNAFSALGVPLRLSVLKLDASMIWVVALHAYSLESIAC